MCCGSFKVYVVVACTGTYNDLELLGSVEDLLIYDVTTDDDSLYIGYCGEELSLGGVLLECNDIKACIGEDLTYPCYGRCCEWLFGGNKYLGHDFW